MPPIPGGQEKRRKTMLVLSIALIIVGAVIGFGAFAHAAKNMSSFGGGSFGNMFKQHLSSMVVMAFGGLVSLVGGIFFIVYLVKG